MRNLEPLLMNHELLWAPWRLSYLTGPKDTASKDRSKFDKPVCFFCAYRDSTDDAANFVVQRSSHAFVLLNRYPYNNGHLLVAPLAHIGEFTELSTSELADCQALLQHLITVMQPLMNCDGFNIGMNLGKAAGAGVPGHLHWHLVPRWSGDHNFLPVTSATHVINQSLEDFYQQLKSVM